MKAENRQAEWALTVLRVVVGIIFAVHGGQKLLVMGLSNVAGFFGQLGLPAPTLTAVMVTALELLGGGALIVGWSTRIAAALLAVDMLGAILTVHLRQGFFLPKGMEFALTLLVANVALVVGGAGMASVNDLWKRGEKPAAARGQRLTGMATHR